MSARTPLAVAALVALGGCAALAPRHIGDLWPVERYFEVRAP